MQQIMKQLFWGISFHSGYVECFVLFLVKSVKFFFGLESNFQGCGLFTSMHYSLGILVAFSMLPQLFQEKNRTIWHLFKMELLSILQFWEQTFRSIDLVLPCNQSMIDGQSFSFILFFSRRWRKWRRGAHIVQRWPNWQTTWCCFNYRRRGGRPASRKRKTSGRLDKLSQSISDK